MACEGGEGGRPCSGEVGVACAYECVLKTKCILCHLIALTG